MSRSRRHARVGWRAVLAVAVTAAVATAAYALLPGGRAALDLFVVPVLIGAATMGRRGGLTATALALAATGGFGVMLGRMPVPPLELAAWACALTATAWVAGSLRDRRNDRRRALHEAHHAVRDLLVRLVTASGQPAGGHAARVAARAIEVGRTFGLTDGDLAALQAAGWVHELGGSSATLASLRRAGGEGVNAEDGVFLERVIAIVELQNERWDGSGPRGLKGGEIPLVARILAVADAAESGHERPAGLQVPPAGMDAWRQSGGKQFDPDVVAAFLRPRLAEGRGAA